MAGSIKPPRLKPGDTVGIVAPASNIKPALLEAGVRELERLGFQTRYFPSIFEKELYTAGSDYRRAGELIWMFADPEVRAIFAARGGYGSARIIKLLNEEIIRANPKILMGYSDITTLLIYLQREFNWVVFHGPMVTREFAGGQDHYDEELLRRVLCRPERIGEIDTTGAAVLSQGVATGRLTGGCLPMLTSSLGTPYAFDATDSMLFIEDYGSKPYQVDRMLTQLRDAGKFKDVRGLIFGEMTECFQHADQGYTIVDVIQDRTHDLNIPVLFGVRSGHSDYKNQVLPFGVRVTLDCHGGKIIIEESATSDQ